MVGSHPGRSRRVGDDVPKRLVGPLASCGSGCTAHCTSRDQTSVAGTSRRRPDENHAAGAARRLAEVAPDLRRSRSCPARRRVRQPGTCRSNHSGARTSSRVSRSTPVAMVCTRSQRTVGVRWPGAVPEDGVEVVEPRRDRPERGEAQAHRFAGELRLGHGSARRCAAACVNSAEKSSAPSSMIRASRARSSSVIGAPQLPLRHVLGRDAAPACRSPRRRRAAGASGHDTAARAR